MGECADCGLPLNNEVPRCLSCRMKKKKAGLCWWCGEKPIKSKQSYYCEECQQEAIRKSLERGVPDIICRRHRGSDARENRYETRSGG